MNRLNGSDTDRNSEKKKNKKFLAGTAAVVTAALVAVTAICVSAEPETPAAETADLTTTAEDIELTVADTEEESSEELTGFILTDVSDVVEEALPSVVSITSRTLVNNYYDSFGGYGGNGGLEEFFRYFFGDSYGGDPGYYYYDGNGDSYGGQQTMPEAADDAEDSENEEGEEETPDEIESGLGSGTIIAETSTELLILTSYHVVEGSSSLYVTFNDGNSVDGTIKSADANKDIAIVSVPLEDISKETMDAIKIATVCDEPAEVGEGVIVIGNALGYGTSVTTGIVSAVDRDIYIDGMDITVLQTDAAINNGNSGGCMLNSKGEIIGISEAKVVLNEVEGMCYAIPIYSNLDLIHELLNTNEIYDESTSSGLTGGAYLGILGRNVTPDLEAEYEDIPQGVYVSSTVKGSGAEAAGIQSGDVIVGFDDVEITSMAELQAELAKHEAGDTVTLTIRRPVAEGFNNMTIEVTLTDIIS